MANKTKLNMQALKGLLDDMDQPLSDETLMNMIWPILKINPMIPKDVIFMTPADQDTKAPFVPVKVKNVGAKKAPKYKGQAQITELHKDGSETVKQVEAVPSQGHNAPPKTPLCEVGIKAGTTINLGNFQSARFDVSLTIPCEIGEQDPVFEFAKDWVDKRLDSLIDEVKKVNGV